MAFDPAVFEAELALGLVPTEEMPRRAQDALEAGYDGAGVVRMAVLEKPSGWEVDQVVPRMLEDLRLRRIEATEGAVRLGRVRAERILASGEDPLLSASYFDDLAKRADYPVELVDCVGYFEDVLAFGLDDEEMRAIALGQLRELVDPELYRRRVEEGKAAWEAVRAERQERARQDWPFVLNSPGGRSLLREWLREKFGEARLALAIQVGAWVVLGWSLGSWRTVVFGLLLAVPFSVGIGALGLILRLRRKRKDELLRMGYWE